MRSSTARLHFNAAILRQESRAAMHALLQFALLATVVVSIVFGMAASYELQHRGESLQSLRSSNPIPHVTHGGRVHTLYSRS